MTEGIDLPRVLYSVRDRLPPRGDGEGVLFHDLSLTDLIRLSSTAGRRAVVDVDSVEGLSPDAAALSFVTDRLGIWTVITRRPALALRAVRLGCLALLHVHCLDSTGFERALEGHPGEPVGTAVSPGVVLEHLAPGQRRSLPLPVVAYGLVRRREEVEAALAAGAAAVMTTPAPGQPPPAPPRLRRGAGPG